MIYVTGLSAERAAAGQTVCIFGGFFDNGCTVEIGSKSAEIFSIDEDCIEVAVPFNVGSYNVYVKSGSRVVSAGTLAVVQLNALPLPAVPFSYKVTNFVKHLVSLFPRGEMFDLRVQEVEPEELAQGEPVSGSFIGKFIWGVAYSLKMCWGKVVDIVNELSPAHTTSFSEWETELQLPVKGLEKTTDKDRRAEIYRKACGRRGNTPTYFKFIAGLFGIECDIYEYWQNPEEFETNLPADEMNHYWMIRTRKALLEIDVATCIDPCTVPLRSWNNPFFVSAIERLKPAHTKVLYAWNNKLNFDGRIAVTGTAEIGG